jgi:hypothetical protein
MDKRETLIPKWSGLKIESACNIMLNTGYAQHYQIILTFF